MNPKAKRNLSRFACIIFLIFFIAISFVLYFFNKLDLLLEKPLITPEIWLENQPWVVMNISSYSFILIQPLSTFFVYLLGSITISVGIYLLIKRESQKSRTWWGFALILWGIGTFLAGTSYQAFAYELKCAGNMFCEWTSLFEIFYLLLTVYSVNAMMMSQVYSSSTGKWRKFQLWYAPLNATVYSILVVIGSVVPVQFLISFGTMVIFLIPGMVMFFIHNTWRFAKYKKRVDFMLMCAWLSMAIVLGVYYVAAMLSLTEIMWNRGTWFSDNDVLHIGLILWMLYIGFTVKKFIADLPQ
jgi:hypothetical protein